MSQDTFPFADTEEASSYADGAGPDRKKLLVLGAAGAVVVLLAGGWFLFAGGSSSETTTSAFVPAVRHLVKPVSPAVGNVAKELPAPYKATLGRDPFKALYVAPAPAVAPATGTTSTGTSPGTTTTSTGTMSTGSTPTSTGGTGTTTPTSTRYTLKLVSISKPSPEVRFTTWKVGSDSKTVIPSQRFGKYGEIVVLAFSKNAQGVVDKAVIQVGDDSPMDVAIGESVSVL